MKLYIKFVMALPVFFLIGANSNFSDPIYSQIEASNVTNNKSWISQRDNLNVTMTLTPTVPTVDQPTEIQFEIRELDNGNFYNDLAANVTIFDSDGRLFKFPGQPVPEGVFSVVYIFPDDAENNIILQMERNSTSFGLASFEVIVPPLPPPTDWLSQLFQPRPI